MSLSPRYSLLTLLVLTALVAGGVKLWYGPHHLLVRETSPLREHEYTYTRDWRGEKSIQGVLVMRYFDDAGLQNAATLYYVRGPHDYCKVSLEATSEHGGDISRWPDRSALELSELEHRVWRLAIRHEKEQLLRNGGNILENYDP